VAPTFFASGARSADSWEVRLRLVLRVTNEAGAPFSGRAVLARRKAAAKSWFNQHWFAKTLAVMQHIGKDGSITIGAGDRQLAVSTAPKSWTCPVSIDSAAVERMMQEQKSTSGNGSDVETDADND